MIGDIIYWTFMTICLFGALFWCNFYPMWYLIYKPREVSKQFDKSLESLKINLRLNPKNLDDLPATKLNHALFGIWIFLFIALQYFYCNSLFDFYRLNGGLIPICVFILYLSFKFLLKLGDSFIEKYPEKKKSVCIYLNEDWKIGIFVLTFFLTLLEISKQATEYVFSLSLVKFMTKTVKISVVVATIIYGSLLMTTALKIDRENFVQFCSRIHPVLVVFTRNIYNGFDRRFNESDNQ
jgi:hypothetical protein